MRTKNELDDGDRSTVLDKTIKDKYTNISQQHKIKLNLCLIIKVTQRLDTQRYKFLINVFH